MKKTILFLGALAISSVAMCQIEFGIKAGLNLADQKFDTDFGDISLDSRTSFHGGVFLTTWMSDQMAIQPELLYNSVGSKSGDLVTKMNYLSIPVLFRYQIIELLNVHAGPQFGLFLNGEQEFDGDASDIEDVKTLDTGLAFGAGVDLPAGINFTLRYILGLSNIDDTDGGDFDDYTVKNNVLQLSVGYKLIKK